MLSLCRSLTTVVSLPSEHFNRSDRLPIKGVSVKRWKAIREVKLSEVQKVRSNRRRLREEWREAWSTRVGHFMHFLRKLAHIEVGFKWHVILVDEG